MEPDPGQVIRRQAETIRRHEETICRQASTIQQGRSTFRFFRDALVAHLANLPAPSLLTVNP